MSLQTGDLLCNQSFEVTLELLSHKCVKHRTNATIQIGYVPGHIQCKVQSFRIRAFRVIILGGGGDLNSSKENDNVVRRPTDEEGEDDDKYELDRTALLLHAGGHDADSNADVTVHHHEQRQKKEEQELLVITDQTPALHGALRVS